MILWTIQHREAFLSMLRTGSLRADPDRLLCRNDFADAYDWMAQQMRMRISDPTEDVKYPVWLWHTWEGRRKRPDMRLSGYADKGTPIVLMTVDVPDELVLLSDFDRWHFVMAAQYLPDDEADDYSRPYNDVCESWNKIFDISSEHLYYSDCLSIQATTWEIRREWVKKAEFFVAR